MNREVDDKGKGRKYIARDEKEDKLDRREKEEEKKNKRGRGTRSRKEGRKEGR